MIAEDNKTSVVQEALVQSGAPCVIHWIERTRSPMLPGGHPQWTWSDAFESGAANSNTSPAAERRLLDNDLAALIYTSGSTGEPKGVMTTHANMVSASQSVIQYLENTERDVVLNCLPLSFGYGLYQAIMAVMFGGTLVLERSFIFLDEILRRIGSERVTGFPIAPTIAAMMLNLRNLEKYDLSSIRYLTNAAAALPVEHIARLRKALPHVAIYPHVRADRMQTRLLSSAGRNRSAAGFGGHRHAQLRGLHR